MHEATWISDRGCPIGKWRLLDYDRQGGRTRSSSSSWDQRSRASEGFGFAGSLDAHHVASQEIDPVLLRRTEQYVGCSERNVVGGKLGDQWRQETDIPEFTCFPPVARGDMADRLPVGDKFSQTDVIVLHPFVLVDPHAGFGHLLESVQLIGVHPDDVIGVDQATGERIRGFPDSVVEECPGSEVAPRQRAHWWTFRQVLVLGFADLLRERPHFREL